MRVLIAAVGSRGDVAPYAGLGARLQAAGHAVTVAANAPFAQLVSDAGVAFAELPGDIHGIVALPDTGRRPSPRFLARRVGLLTEYFQQAGDGLLRAASAGTDVLLLNASATYGYDIAEGLGIPSAGVFAQPIEPTAEFPPMLLNTARSLGRFGNRLAGQLVLRTLTPYQRTSARLRDQLAMPPRGAHATLAKQRAEGWPVWHGFSPAVLPRPKDWRSNVEVVGYWWPPAPRDWQSPADLVDFLAAGPEPVYLGFGSMAAGQGGWLAELVTEAVRLAKVRAVLQAGWAELAVDTDDIQTVPDIPHEWLFGQVAAAVHHGGAGTTAAALRAGLPSVVCPIYADQPLWGARVAALGAGPAPIPFRELTAPRLAEAIRAAVSEPRYGTSAAILARQINAEDGAAAVLSKLDQLVGS